MLQTLKFRGDEKSFFFSSDLHIWQSCSSWDKPLWKMRGYDSKESHREGVIKKWNETCDEGSTCFLLGDHVFEDEGGDEFVELLQRLRYKTIYLFLGNHNSGHSIIYKKILAEKFPGAFAIGAEVYPLEWQINSIKKAVFLPQYAEICINKNFAVLCHYALASHNKQGKGSYGLFGHSHNNLQLTNKELGKGRRLEVGWDAWGKPVNFFEIKKHLEKRDLDILDHH